MRWRCPSARSIGTATLDGWRLLFKGSRTGSYLTIEREEKCDLPVAVWEVSPEDELALDRYEGFPAFYYKREFRLRRERPQRKDAPTAFAYIMHEEHPVGVPSLSYMRTCLEGYDTFHFDRNILLDAYRRSSEAYYG